METELTKLKFVIAFVKAFHVSYISHKMGFSLPNPGLFEMYWIWHMNHCQLDVETHPQTMGGKSTRSEVL